jgi:hypothetical protein
MPAANEATKIGFASTCTVTSSALWHSFYGTPAASSPIRDRAGFYEGYFKWFADNRESRALCRIFPGE